MAAGETGLVDGAAGRLFVAVVEIDLAVLAVVTPTTVLSPVWGLASRFS
jgi:hypothetical protein